MCAACPAFSAPARRSCVITSFGSVRAAEPDYFCQKPDCTEFCGIGVIEPGRIADRKEGDNIEVTGFVRDAAGLTVIHACKVEKTTGTKAITATNIDRGTENFGGCSTSLLPTTAPRGKPCPHDNTASRLTRCHPPRPAYTLPAAAHHVFCLSAVPVVMHSGGRGEVRGNARSPAKRDVNAVRERADSVDG